MNKSPAISAVFILTIAFFILPTAQAANIELSDTCSLADAITAANTDKSVGECPAGGGADTITLSSDIMLDAALPHITSEITVKGDGRMISGNSRYRIFAVNGGTLTVSNLTMTKGFADWGGAIVNVNNGTLTIKDSNISNSSASEGGAIGSEGTLSISNSDVSNNWADTGGAVHHVKGPFVISDSTLNANRSEDEGGAIYNSGETLKITNSSFSRNLGGTGDAIYNKGSIVEIINGTFNDNVKDGAIWNEKGKLVIRTSIFSGNATTNWNGGAVFSKYHDSVNIFDSIFRNNRAPSKGGAVYSYSLFGTLRIVNSTFMHNSAEYGAAIYNADTLIVTSSTFRRNRASESGGAIYNYQLDELNISNSTFDSNVAGEIGGAVYVGEDGEATLTHLTMVNNSAKRGGGIYKDAEAELTLHNTIIASSSGGDCFGRLNQNINNLIEDGSCFPTLMGDPMLGELVEPYDGSPAYYPLLEGSPAIDAADGKHCPKTDQVGTKRPQGSGCDIGAYELPTASDN